MVSPCNAKTGKDFHALGLLPPIYRPFSCTLTRRQCTLMAGVQTRMHTQASGSRRQASCHLCMLSSNGLYHSRLHMSILCLSWPCCSLSSHTSSITTSTLPLDHDCICYPSHAISPRRANSHRRRWGSPCIVTINAVSLRQPCQNQRYLPNTRRRLSVRLARNGPVSSLISR
jgi:hypothetical protein